MATRAQKVRLSVFLIASGSLLLVTLLVLAGSRLFSRMDPYGIEYRDVSVSGLEAGAPVKYHGVQVGRVMDLSVTDPATVFVRVEVRRGTPITRDTKAVLTLAGITGLKFVELVGGSEESGILPPGGNILPGMSMFDTISGRAEDVIAKTEQVLNNLNQMLSPETAAALHQLLVSLAGVSEQTEGMLAENRAVLASSLARFDTILVSLASTSARVDTTMQAVASLVHSSDVNASVENLRHMTDRLRSEVDSMRISEALADFQTLVRNSNQMVVHSDLLVVQARSDVLRSLVSLEEALDNLREATDIIRDNPSVLIRGRQTSSDRLE